ncbi:uncharacterized protein KIAA2013 homolog isoform X2 [Octopus bimaculoides]|uniref:uncharacterized protein KIAA2013 homolog isoform X2 n=1 Tax=Octopus bimaculoides TaxID=37653 RepID=UPI00071C89A5|nr:uncharacterized protein KIAA2013 homolog isoform X2 [Octopus bimaculoides]|eukprot:XP_014783639.1 PREDICTED: uncharacterized protein KIAA2013 homolog isoform X2 [Octopus bimaculoides]
MLVRSMLRYGLISALRFFTCRNIFLSPYQQMWLKSKLHGVFSVLARSKRTVLVVILLLIIIAYFVPFNFDFSRSKFSANSISGCIEEKLSIFQHSIESDDAIVILPEPVDSETYLPYVGNGKVAAAFKTQKGLYIRTNRALSLPVHFYPIVETNVRGHESKEAHVLDIKAGLAYQIQSFKKESECVSVGSQLYAHRSRPSVLVQDIRIHNQSPIPVVLELHRPTAQDCKWSAMNYASVSSVDGVQFQYANCVVAIPNSELVVVVGLAVVKIPPSILIKSMSTIKLHIVTVTHYSLPVQPQHVKGLKEELSSKVISEMREILHIDEKKLRQEHTLVWSKLWESGISISHSKAANALNGHKINATMYYVLSNVLSPMHDFSTSDESRNEVLSILHYPDRCYSGHSTLFSSTLWLDAASEDAIARIVTTWMITLEKQGCSVMVKSGAEGVLQALVLSIGGLHFTNHHLELTLQPKDLHRDFFFRRINYGNNTHLNISVIVGEDNKANLFVSLDRNNRPYYACDAGCIDPPVMLSKKWAQFPVKLTNPITSILYITADKLHMEELKHAIHVREIAEAPAHEHHVIALHKHGHKFGGLPTLFWVSIAFLVTVFHLFLFKLIYNEYCQGQEIFSRSKYNL